MSEAKQFDISKKAVIAAFQAVKENAGSYGADEQTIKEFEEHLNNNLYKLWNRMASGSYFPKPVRAVAIPKKNGGIRILGIPTVEDRIAQMVAKMYFEPLVEPMFYNDSYGYRPNKSAIQAVGQARERCFKRDWVLELDIKGLFDNIKHGYLMYSTMEVFRMKQKVPMICNIVSLILLIVVVIKSIVDYTQYSTSLNSAPFYLWVLVNALFLVIPAIILFVIGFVVKKKQ